MGLTVNCILQKEKNSGLKDRVTSAMQTDAHIEEKG